MNESIQIANVTTGGNNLIAGQTTITLNPVTFNDGAQLGVGALAGMAAFGGGTGYATLDTGNQTSEEQVSFTGLTVDSSFNVILSGVRRLAPYPPYTASAGILYAHNGNVPFTFSDNPAFLASVSTSLLSTNNTFTGANSFSQNIIIPTVPTVGTDATSKTYVDTQIASVVAGGAVPATTTILGIVKMSIAPVSPASPIVVGDNDSRVPTLNQAGALVGTNGAPSSINPYVTKSDVSVAVVSSSIPRRDATGNLQVVSAINPTDVTPKSYVDAFYSTIVPASGSFTQAIPILQPNSWLRVTVPFTVVALVGASSTSTATLTLGGQTVGTFVVTNNGPTGVVSYNTAGGSGTAIFYIRNNASLSAQTTYSTVSNSPATYQQASGAAAGTSSATGASTSSGATTTVNTGVSTSLVLSITNFAATLGQSFIEVFNHA